MKQKINDVIFRNSIFIWIAIITGVILLVPLLAMQFTTAIIWDETDFVVMGILLFGMSGLFVLVARKTSHKHRVILGCMFITALLYIWAELAVGVFTNLGS